MRYRLRTLMILMAVLPPLLWFGWWQWTEYKARQERWNRLVEMLRYNDVGQFNALAIGQFLAEKAKRERSAEPNPELSDDGVSRPTP